jgi:hypothetical protein
MGTDDGFDQTFRTCVSPMRQRTIEQMDKGNQETLCGLWSEPSGDIDRRPKQVATLIDHMPRCMPMRTCRLLPWDAGCDQSPVGFFQPTFRSLQLWPSSD